MTRAGWWLVSVLSRGLESCERQAVLGDLAESGGGIWPAIRDLLGLVVRRQAALWRDWQPWLLLGTGAIAAGSLNRISGRFSLDFFEQWSTYQRYGVHYATGLTPRQDFAFLICLALGLIVWSWTSGFVLGSLSGRAVWTTLFVFCLLILNSAPLLLPALCGAVMGARRGMLSIRDVSILAGAVIALAILATWMIGWYETAQFTWSGGQWRGGSRLEMLPFLLVSWPAFYLLINADRQRTNKGKTT